MTGAPTRNSLKYFISIRWSYALGVAACLLALMACQLSQTATQPVGVPSTGEATAEATTGGPGGSTAEATAGAIQSNVEFGPGPFNLVNPTMGLAELSGYKAELTLSFDGTQAGQPSQWAHIYVMLASQEPATHQITIEAAGGALAPVFMAEVNGVSYERRGEGDCTASTTRADSSLAARWEPAGFLPAFLGADAAGSETINGMAADRYIFDERALGETGFTQSTGQVWVASDTGVVIRYLLTTTAGADYFGEGIEGTLTWEYDLTEFNQPVTIILPAGCSAGQGGAPLIPDAQSVSWMPGLTIYSTAGSIPDVMAFYQEQLPDLGWETTGEPIVADAMGWVSFVRGDQQLSVIVSPLESMVEVRLLMGTVLGLAPTH